MPGVAFLGFVLARRIAPHPVPPGKDDRNCYIKLFRNLSVEFHLGQQGCQRWVFSNDSTLADRRLNDRLSHLTITLGHNLRHFELAILQGYRSAQTLVVRLHVLTSIISPAIF